MTTALVLGGTGFVGRGVSRELLARGFETVTASRREVATGEFSHHVVVDRNDEAGLARVVREVNPDVLADLAAFQPADIQAAIRTFSGGRYIFISTGVYPDLFGKPADESDFVPLDGPVPTEALDYLGGKRWCETVLARNPDFPWTVVRPPAIFGPADHTLRIVAYIQRIEDKGPLLVPAETVDRGVGAAWVRDVGQVVANASDLARETNNRAYNVGYDGLTLRQLLGAFAEAMGAELELVPIPYNDLPDGASPYGPNPRRSSGYDISRARTELGFEPAPVGDAVADTLAWYRATQPTDPGYAGRNEELRLAAAAKG